MDIDRLGVMAPISPKESAKKGTDLVVFSVHLWCAQHSACAVFASLPAQPQAVDQIHNRGNKLKYILNILLISVLGLGLCSVFAAEGPVRIAKPEDVVIALYRDFGWELTLQR